MAEKKLPFSGEQLTSFVEEFPTPFYIYDEKGMRESVRQLVGAFAWAPNFKEYYAVKACPTPGVLKILKEEGCGMDCASLAELVIAEQVGLVGEEIMFTSNNTPLEEYQKAVELGAVLNLDDISHIDYVEEHIGLPEFVSFRYNPGATRSGNDLIGVPAEAKYGMTREQIFEGYEKLKKYGVKRFGLHTMVASNELQLEYFLETAEMLFDLVREIKEKTGCEIEMLNFGGGIGIPYLPGEKSVDLPELGRRIEKLYQEKLVSQGITIERFALECGRLITGPHGYLVTQATHYKNTYKNYIGVDACMANLMRPGLYGAYHHITVAGKENEPLDQIYDVVGSLCENNDKFAINRSLPKIETGDTLVLHDAGAHSYSMGFQYNGKLRCAEYLLGENGKLRKIRRAEGLEDYFATFIWE
jgi:Diaminopimelate decarboxylase